MLNKPNVLVFKPYAPYEIANIYGVSTRTMRRWTKTIKEKIGHREGLFYNINQVRIIIDHFGIPGSIDLD